MIKTFNGNHETTVDPSMRQAAIDQGIRPAGYDSPITEEPQEMLNFFATQGKYAKRYEEQCCAEKCRAFLDGSYRRGCKNTVEKVLECITDMFEFMALKHGATWNYRDIGECEVELKGAVKALLE